LIYNNILKNAYVVTDIEQLLSEKKPFILP
jgi:hypothetical protein